MHDPNDARQVRHAEQLGKLAEERVAADLCAVMATESGRRFMHGLLGLYTVSVIPHPEVEVKVTVNVARSADEADAQARGEDLTGPVSDRAEIRAAAEALFEQEAEAQDNA